MTKCEYCQSEDVSSKGYGTTLDCLPPVHSNAYTCNNCGQDFWISWQEPFYDSHPRKPTPEQQDRTTLKFVTKLLNLDYYG